MSKKVGTIEILIIILIILGFGASVFYLDFLQKPAGKLEGISEVGYNIQPEKVSVKLSQSVYYLNPLKPGVVPVICEADLTQLTPAYEGCYFCSFCDPPAPKKYVTISGSPPCCNADGDWVLEYGGKSVQGRGGCPYWGATKNGAAVTLFICHSDAYGRDEKFGYSEGTYVQVDCGKQNLPYVCISGDVACLACGSNEAEARKKFNDCLDRVGYGDTKVEETIETGTTIINKFWQKRAIAFDCRWGGFPGGQKGNCEDYGAGIIYKFGEGVGIVGESCWCNDTVVEVIPETAHCKLQLSAWDVRDESLIYSEKDTECISQYLTEETPEKFYIKELNTVYMLYTLQNIYPLKEISLEDMPAVAVKCNVDFELKTTGRDGKVYQSYIANPKAAAYIIPTGTIGGDVTICTNLEGKEVCRPFPEKIASDIPVVIKSSEGGMKITNAIGYGKHEFELPTKTIEGNDISYTISAEIPLFGTYTSQPIAIKAMANRHDIKINYPVGGVGGSIKVCSGVEGCAPFKGIERAVYILAFAEPNDISEPCPPADTIDITTIFPEFCTTNFGGRTDENGAYRLSSSPLAPQRIFMPVKSIKDINVGRTYKIEFLAPFFEPWNKYYWDGEKITPEKSKLKPITIAADAVTNINGEIYLQPGTVEGLIKITTKATDSSFIYMPLKEVDVVVYSDPVPAGSKTTVENELCTVGSTREIELDGLYPYTGKCKAVQRCIIDGSLDCNKLIGDACRKKVGCIWKAGTSNWFCDYDSAYGIWQPPKAENPNCQFLPPGTKQIVLSAKTNENGYYKIENVVPRSIYDPYTLINYKLVVKPPYGMYFYGELLFETENLYSLTPIESNASIFDVFDGETVKISGNIRLPSCEGISKSESSIDDNKTRELIDKFKKCISDPACAAFCEHSLNVRNELITKKPLKLLRNAIEIAKSAVVRILELFFTGVQLILEIPGKVLNLDDTSKVQKGLQEINKGIDKTMFWLRWYGEFSVRERNVNVLNKILRFIGGVQPVW